MKLVRYHEPVAGNRVGVLEGDQVVPLVGRGTTTDLIEGAISRGVSLAELAAAGACRLQGMAPRVCRPRRATGGRPCPSHQSHRGAGNLGVRRDLSA